MIDILALLFGLVMGGFLVSWIAPGMFTELLLEFRLPWTAEVRRKLREARIEELEREVFGEDRPKFDDSPLLPYAKETR